MLRDAKSASIVLSLFLKLWIYARILKGLRHCSSNTVWFSSSCFGKCIIMLSLESFVYKLLELAMRFFIRMFKFYSWQISSFFIVFGRHIYIYVCIYVYIYLAVLTGEGRNFIAPTAITCRLYTMECLYHGMRMSVYMSIYICSSRYFAGECRLYPPIYGYYL